MSVLWYALATKEISPAALLWERQKLENIPPYFLTEDFPILGMRYCKSGPVAILERDSDGAPKAMEVRAARSGPDFVPHRTFSESVLIRHFKEAQVIGRTVDYEFKRHEGSFLAEHERWISETVVEPGKSVAQTLRVPADIHSAPVGMERMSQEEFFVTMRVKEGEYFTQNIFKQCLKEMKGCLSFLPSWQVYTELVTPSMLHHLNSGASMLSVGCGMAFLEQILHEKFGIRKSAITLADINLNARLKNEGYPVHRYDMAQMWPDLGKKFRFVIFPQSFGVALERAEDRVIRGVRILSEAEKQLENGGQIRIVKDGLTQEGRERVYAQLRQAGSSLRRIQIGDGRDALIVLEPVNKGKAAIS